jgi:3D (Asp-Asp-Asp) domain-containing protein
MKYLAVLLLAGTAFASDYTPEYKVVTVTAYCSNCPICCGEYADGKTATMRDAKLSGVAVDKKLIPLGSRLDIPGYGNWQLADDVGSAIKGDHIDVRFNDHQKALEWGVKKLKIRIWRKNANTGGTKVPD